MQFGQERHISGKSKKRVLRPSSLDTDETHLLIGSPLHDQTTSNLRDLIVEGSFPPGSRLVEADLCRRLRVSRTPLREAFKVLSGEGLIELQPNRGAMVARVTADEVRELFAVIAELESMAAILCSKAWSIDEFTQLETMHREMLELHTSGQRHDYFAINDRIHRTIVALSGNRILAITHARLIARARRARYQALLLSGRWDESVAEHESMMDALRARKGKQAARILRNHVLATGKLVAQQIANEERA